MNGENKMRVDERDALDFAKKGAVEASPEDFLNAKGALALLKKAKEAKTNDFEKLEADFWKGEKPGDTLQGIYLGCERGKKQDGTDKKLLVHIVGTLDSKNKPLARRFNGTAILTRQLKRVPVGSAVCIVFQGKGATADGDQLNNFDVTHIPPEKLQG